MKKEKEPIEKVVLERKINTNQTLVPRENVVQSEKVGSRRTNNGTVLLQNPTDIQKQLESGYDQSAYQPKVKLSDLKQSQAFDSSITEKKQKKPIAEEFHSKEDIAIVGISGRFPGADNVEDFWMNLIEEKDSVIEVPKDRWDADEIFSADSRAPHKSYSKVGGL
ncbi:hypothetical protein CG709_11690 [Lachnotalea glycerini]|nr:hypothetical protein CG709_11690 [Lachnotalea glycerini]